MDSIRRRTCQSEDPLNVLSLVLLDKPFSDGRQVPRTELILQSQRVQRGHNADGGLAATPSLNFNVMNALEGTWAEVKHAEQGRGECVSGRG